MTAIAPAALMVSMKAPLSHPLSGISSTARLGLYKCGVLGYVRDQPFRPDQVKRIAKCIHTDVDFGRQAAARTADYLIVAVFSGGVVGCRWARTAVESLNNSFESASPWRTSATLTLKSFVSH